MAPMTYDVRCLLAKWESEGVFRPSDVIAPLACYPATMASEGTVYMSERYTKQGMANFQVILALLSAALAASRKKPNDCPNP